MINLWGYRLGCGSRWRGCAFTQRPDIRDDLPALILFKCSFKSRHAIFPQAFTYYPEQKVWLRGDLLRVAFRAEVGYRYIITEDAMAALARKLIKFLPGYLRIEVRPLVRVLQSGVI